MSTGSCGKEEYGPRLLLTKIMRREDVNVVGGVFEFELLHEVPSKSGLSSLRLALTSQKILPTSLMSYLLDRTVSPLSTSYEDSLAISRRRRG